VCARDRIQDSTDLEPRAFALVWVVADNLQVQTHTLPFIALLIMNAAR
jgi:hypothetical protein